MTTQEFIEKWKATTLKERSASQEHFIDLCNLLGHQTPAAADPTGEWFTFEKGAKKTGGGNGWADVWKKGCFAWEYKGKHKNLDEAFKQLQRYAIALENPPLLVVCDMERFIIHTNYTNTVQVIHEFTIEDLTDPDTLHKLRWLFDEPERLKPTVTTDQITAKAAAEFAVLAQSLRNRDHEPLKVAHFLNKILFCLFAEDADLLPRHIFERLLDAAVDKPDNFTGMLASLFLSMTEGGMFGVDKIDWFNGGLFDGDEVIELNKAEIRALASVSKLDWSQIQPSIFGTLFERGLDPTKRSQLGAHYTDPDSIMRLVLPVVIDPLMKEWEETKPKILVFLEKHDKVTSKPAKKKAIKDANNIYQGFLLKLRQFRVLDPACGSGNFLYLALRSLKDLEHLVTLEAEVMGLPLAFPEVGPQCVLGIELNTYAAELARVTVWIGEIQWMLDHGYNPVKNPILKKLDQIDCRDALINGDGTEAEWPDADAIVGNPPFIGGKKMKAELGDTYTKKLRGVFNERLPAIADLVTYFFEKARYQLENGNAKRVGLVSTQAIRNGGSRTALDRINESGKIYNAWADEPWVNDGADVRVSFICFCSASESLPVYLNGATEDKILSDLTPQNINETLDLTKVESLDSNKNRAFIGTQKSGSFDVSGEIARDWLTQPNPNSRPNSDVVKPWLNGRAITSRNTDKWIVYFEASINELDASLYEMPFEHIKQNVHDELLKKIEKNKIKSKSTKDMEKQLEKWWVHWRPRPELNDAIKGLSHCIATVRVSKYRFFVWIDTNIVVDSRLLIIASDSWSVFGILSSKVHELWSLAKSSMHGVGNDPTYNAQSCFETYPFPEGLSPKLKIEEHSNPHSDAIAEAAKRLNELRENWLNPPEWVKRVPEVVQGYPDRILPADENAAKQLKKRTLTNLYNQRPAWLNHAHKELDAAVATAYGWEVDLSDNEILKRLFELNQQRVDQQNN